MSEQPEMIYPTFEEAMEMLSTAGLFYSVDNAADDLVIRIPISEKKGLTSRQKNV